MKQVNRHPNAPKARRMMILKVDANHDMTSLSEPARAAIKAGGIAWVEGRMVGTRVYLGKQLMLILTSLSRDTLTDWLTTGYPVADESGDVANVDLGLNWTVQADEDTKISKTTTIKFLDNAVTYDENGDIASSTRPTSINGKLQTFSGRQWMY